MSEPENPPAGCGAESSPPGVLGATAQAMLGRIDLSLPQLQYFVVAADCGSVSAAAIRLHASQSAVSSAILRLERQLQIQLFIRHHARGIVLTESGRRLVADARAILRSVMDLQERSRSLQGVPVGETEIACFTPLASFVLPPIHQLVRERYPGLMLNVREVDGTAAAESVRDGLCELALTFDSARTSQGVRFIPLSRLRPYALVAPDDPLAAVGQASLGELCERPLIILDYGDGAGFVRGLISSQHLNPPRTTTTSTFETMRGLVAAGVGFGIVNQPAGTRLLHEGVALAQVEIVDRLPMPAIGVAIPDRGRPTRRVEALTEICAEVFGAVYGQCDPPESAGASTRGAQASPTHPDEN
ncbi:LysR substrate-binding domain-containing protein [Streptomyces sp. S.PB5]|uniref:LysR family transcriptional regulator n=1 Tax=Streptomyces sp. S.PB5 TaxID=3020844 RepID=UPI0025B19B43|nr:LysR substrate-binding domain-containing protein [Streptomyces sp. S.PB5]MDN3028089.1 LysR substrate-binding domain-containing protein [Streptomyces sp. S.PB5]